MNTSFPKTATCVPSMRGMGASFAGRKGMPREWLMMMYADYQAGLSLAEVGAKHGRTRQSVFDIFKRRGLQLRARQFKPAVIYRGVKYTEQKTCGRHRYLRATVRKGVNLYLHHVIWCEHNGPIPAGYKVCFKDGNHRNVDINNLELLSNSEQVRKHATGANGATVVARDRLKQLLNPGQSAELLATLNRRKTS